MCSRRPCMPRCGGTGGGGQCAPDDLVCLGGGTGGGGQCAPDDLVCLGGGTDGNPPLDEKSGGIGACFDGIDNDGDGKIDQEDTIDWAEAVHLPRQFQVEQEVLLLVIIPLG